MVPLLFKYPMLLLMTEKCGPESSQWPKPSSVQIVRPR